MYALSLEFPSSSTKFRQAVFLSVHWIFFIHVGIFSFCDPLVAVPLSPEGWQPRYFIKNLSFLIFSLLVSLSLCLLFLLICLPVHPCPECSKAQKVYLAQFCLPILIPLIPLSCSVFPPPGGCNPTLPFLYGGGIAHDSPHVGWWAEEIANICY